ncbi:MAG: hypothetical protein CO128_01440 [Ignavibacteriales bacterium CG_4_9_14_3_um_filter_30_11]|nr:MAG: hypothetical protein CO128_01440 [Ignavibacteriales bacterium CG_4_9_14_3_um_filter_30_11]
MKSNIKKKILFVDHDIGLSGSTISMSYLIKEFCNTGFKVLVLTKNDSKGLKYLSNSGAEIIQYSSSPFKSITLSLHFSDKGSFLSKKWSKNLFKDLIRFFNGIILSVKIINKYKPDLIYLNEYVTIQFALYAKLRSLLVFVHIRSLFIDQKFNIRIMLLKKALKNIPQNIFAITKLEAEQLNSIKNEKVKIEIVPEFLFEEDFHLSDNLEKIKKSFGTKDSSKIITFLGGIKEIKGSIDFISAIELLSEDYPNVKFILAGKIFDNTVSQDVYPYFKMCNEFIDRPKVKPFINVLGEIENIKDLLSISDIIVSCSIESHFNRPIIEAWALKKAVIATDVSHSIKLIENGSDGILVPKNNPKELANKIKKLLNDESLLSNLGLNGYKKAKDNFDGKSYTKKIVNYCIEIFNNK